MRKTTALDSEPGQRIYNRFTLSVYDWYVLGFSNRFVWRCPTSRLLAHYQRHVSDNHLDVGVGTGYFLDRCCFGSNNTRIGILDLNPASLRKAAQRIRRYAPELYWRDSMKPFDINGPAFDSIGVNYLLHCLPGTMKEKSVVFGHVRKHLNPGGTVFGATLLGNGVSRSSAARKLMRFYNTQRIFCNESDDPGSLQTALAEYFPHSGIEIVGCVGLFWAKTIIPPGRT